MINNKFKSKSFKYNENNSIIFWSIANINQSNYNKISLEFDVFLLKLIELFILRRLMLIRIYIY